MNNFPDRRIILFDGVCNLCNGFVQFILKHEKDDKLLFASLQSDTGIHLMAMYGIDPATSDSVVFIDGDQVSLKSRAALNIAGYLKFPWKLWVALKIVPPFFSNWIYDLVAKYRYRWFGKRDSCYVPTPELRKRFLDD